MQNNMHVRFFLFRFSFFPLLYSSFIFLYFRARCPLLSDTCKTSRSKMDGTKQASQKGGELEGHKRKDEPRHRTFVLFICDILEESRCPKPPEAYTVRAFTPLVAITQLTRAETRLIPTRCASSHQTRLEIPAGPFHPGTPCSPTHTPYDDRRARRAPWLVPNTRSVPLTGGQTPHGDTAQQGPGQCLPTWQL